MDGKENKDKKTRKDVSIQLVFSSTKMLLAVLVVTDMTVVYTLNMSDNIKYMRGDGQGQQTSAYKNVNKE